MLQLLDLPIIVTAGIIKQLKILSGKCKIKWHPVHKTAVHFTISLFYKSAYSY